MWRLDPRCELGVLASPARRGEEHEDLGCGLQGPASRAVRRALDPLRRRIRRMGEARALSRAVELVRWLESRPEYASLCTNRVVAGRRRLRRRVVYGPASHLAPRLLHLRHATSGFDYRGLDWPVARDQWPPVHDLCVLLLEGAPERRIRAAARAAGAEPLIDRLRAAAWLGEQPDDTAPAGARREGVWFVGHNTALVASRTTRVIVDPWFRPWRDADPSGYRALRPCDIGPVDAVAITHSHGDHFHLGSLLAFPRDTPVFVPFVERESILATNLERRLGEVGFTRVRALRWWEAAGVGDIRLESMPFRGEQATTLALVEPELRNTGNTWIVRTPRLAAAFLADTGRDPLGSMQQAALEARRRWGKTDIVFGGARGFSLYPLFLPFTSLDAMFVNVPLDLMAARQRLMNDAGDLLDVAEILGASHAVPYADGGAPWYWREGMGPAYAGYPSYPGERDAPGRDEEDPRSTPFPERLDEEATRRYGARPLVQSLVLRPGDLAAPAGGRWRAGRVEGFAWPYEC